MQPVRVGVALLACSLASAAVAAPARAPIVVTLVIDQFPAAYADARWPLLPASGGFARLRREGTRATIAYDYAVTDTAPGHAALMTGASPRESGIYANEILDPATRKKVSILRDPSTRVLAADEKPRAVPSSSLLALRLPTIADGFAHAHPHGTIVSLSLKDRAALPGGGRTPTAAVWFDAGLGGFVTSTAFARAFPAWALAHAGPEAMRAQYARTWTLDDRAFVEAHAATGDAQPGEGDLDGIGVTFPHALARSTNAPHAFRSTPFADEVLLALAVDAIDAAPPSQPMLLALSLSANDYVGHVFGPDSWEAWDELHRLDAALGRFFAALDARFGARGWSLLVAADHGVERMPEAAHAGGRLLPDELSAHLRAVARRTLGDGDFILGVADPYVYVTDAARALPPERRRALDDALAAALRAEPGVGGVWDARHPPAHCAPDVGLDACVCRSLPTGIPAELYVAVAPGWFFDPDIVVGKGTSHGSASALDRSVPFVVRAPGRVAAGAVERASVPASSFAVTAAHLLGIAPPPGARGGRDLAR
ncbi:MAG TPA: alkaline phosphatase family protein [Polyangia bacterium]